jgi:hypothetical protein
MPITHDFLIFKAHTRSLFQTDHRQWIHWITLKFTIFTFYNYDRSYSTHTVAVDQSIRGPSWAPGRVDRSEDIAERLGRSIDRSEELWAGVVRALPAPSACSVGAARVPVLGWLGSSAARRALQKLVMLLRSLPCSSADPHMLLSSSPCSSVVRHARHPDKDKTINMEKFI